MLLAGAALGFGGAGLKVRPATEEAGGRDVMAAWMASNAAHALYARPSPE